MTTRAPAVLKKGGSRIAIVKDGGGKVLAEKLHFKLQLHWRPGGQTIGEPLFFVIYQYYILILKNIYALCNMLYMTCASLYAQCFIQYALLLALGGKVKQCNERAFVLCFFL